MTLTALENLILAIGTMRNEGRNEREENQADDIEQQEILPNLGYLRSQACYACKTCVTVYSRRALPQSSEPVPDDHLAAV